MQWVGMFPGQGSQETGMGNELLEKYEDSMPQIIVDDKHIGGYNELVEYFADKGLVNFKGEKI